MYHLRELRTQKGLTQAELSKTLQVSASSIGMYEQGRREPDNETLGRIASFFNVTTDYLLGRTDEPGGTAGSAGVAKEEPPTPETDDISSIFDDRDIRALARKNLDGKSPEEIAKKKERLKKMLEFMFDD